MTDAHVHPGRGAPEGLAQCLRHIQSHHDPVQMILNGGDVLANAFDVTLAKAREQADVWQRVLRDECRLPIHHCIGNHDIWGWDRTRSGTTSAEPGWGKGLIREIFGIERCYYSFNRAGWHFIVLDSVHPAPRPSGYIGKLDDEQFDWLQADLAAVSPDVPILVMSHIPILSVTGYFCGNNEKTGDWHVRSELMHIDARRIVDLFARHPNVKLCIAGHMHMTDRCEYQSVTYLCTGAVCGRWWQGNYETCEEGYGLIDLYTDGTFDVQYLPYHWTPKD
jgi:Icc protein